MNVWNVGSDTQVTETVDSGSSASFAAQAIDSTGGCSILILPGSSDGYKNIQVSANVGDHSATVPMTVWFPLDVEIIVAQPVLHPVAGVCAVCSTLPQDRLCHSVLSNVVDSCSCHIRRSIPGLCF